MKVSFVQFAPVLGDSAANRSRIRNLASQFRDADLVVLPELANSGYNFTGAEQARTLAETVDQSPFVAMLVETCSQHRQHIVTGFCEREGDTLYNSALLLGPDGVLGIYRKLHLFWREKEYFAPGNLELSAYTIGACTLGMLICFDWRFPEVWRVLALKGVDVVCHPSNLVTPGLAQRATPIHAVVNRFFVVTANRTGTEGDITFTGLSQIADPEGRVLAEATATDTSVGTADIDLALARNKQATPTNHVLTDRRPEYYRRLLEP